MIKVSHLILLGSDLRRPCGAQALRRSRVPLAVFRLPATEAFLADAVPPASSSVDAPASASDRLTP
jgi:hypothetical protein